VLAALALQRLPALGLGYLKDALTRWASEHVLRHQRLLRQLGMSTWLTGDCLESYYPVACV
jgi:hypothetical protein